MSLTRPSHKTCASCHQPKPLGQFRVTEGVPGRPGRVRYIDLTTCRHCRALAAQAALPGRAFL